MRFPRRKLLQFIGVCAYGFLMHICSSFVEQRGSVHNRSSVLNTVYGPNLSRIGADNVTFDTELSDIYFSVKTSAKFHASRVDALLKTWAGDAKEQTYFFTDADDPVLSKKTDGRVINTKCPTSHKRDDLCCKMSVELDYYFMQSSKRWFCHADDDTYVNLENLLTLLRRFNHTRNWYIGGPSLDYPVILRRRQRLGLPCYKFRFATGGAGFCLSQGLASKMIPYAGGGKLQKACKKIGIPDDVTVGHLLSCSLQQRVTFIQGFHSHIENMTIYNEDNIPKMITLSYDPVPGSLNRVNVTGFNTTYDPTRFLSVHCLLYPQHRICRR